MPAPILLTTAALSVALLPTAALGAAPAKSMTNPLEKRADGEICGEETGEFGLKTMYYCEGSNPVCCQDSTITLEEGIPWNCIPADATCCGRGEYCANDLVCSPSSSSSGYSCRADSGASAPAIVGNTPELDFDRSGMDGGDGGGDGAASTLGLRSWAVAAWGVWLGGLLMV